MSCKRAQNVFVCSYKRMEAMSYKHTYYAVHTRTKEIRFTRDNDFLIYGKKRNTMNSC
jgi:hypothetical protein